MDYRFSDPFLVSICKEHLTNFSRIRLENFWADLKKDKKRWEVFLEDNKDYKFRVICMCNKDDPIFGKVSHFMEEYYKDLRTFLKESLRLEYSLTFDKNTLFSLTIFLKEGYIL